jgi:hypothetical protein
VSHGSLDSFDYLDLTQSAGRQSVEIGHTDHHPLGLVSDTNVFQTAVRLDGGPDGLSGEPDAARHRWFNLGDNWDTSGNASAFAHARLVEPWGRDAHSVVGMDPKAHATQSQAQSREKLIPASLGRLGLGLTSDAIPTGMHTHRPRSA